MNVRRRSRPSRDASVYVLEQLLGRERLTVDDLIAARPERLTTARVASILAAAFERGHVQRMPLRGRTVYSLTPAGRTAVAALVGARDRQREAHQFPVRPLLTLVTLLAVAGAAGAATIQIAGKTCPFDIGRMGQQQSAGFVIPACGEVYVCTFTAAAGTKYSSAGVFTVTGTWRSDRIFATRFEP